MLLFLACLLVLLVGVIVAAAAVRSAGALAGRVAFSSGGDRLGRGGRRLAAVLVAGSAVGSVVWVSALLRDPIVVLDGKREHCSAPIGEDLPAPVLEQCDAQAHDRKLQGLVAGLTAASATALALLSAGRSGRRATQGLGGYGSAMAPTGATARDGSPPRPRT
jgi:hypothetical protein